MNEIINRSNTTNVTKRKGRSLEYIVWHYSAGVSSKKGAARDMAGWFANPAAQSSADFIVDDVEIVQYTPSVEDYYCWSVGSTSKYNTAGGRLWGIATNANVISIEIVSNNKTGKMTYPNDPNYYFTEAALKNAVELTLYLMKKYNIDADHVIRHYDVNGKQCPGIIGWNKETGSEVEWQNWQNKLSNGGLLTITKPVTYFRVRKSWGNVSSQLGAYTVYENAVKNCPPGYSVFDESGKALYTNKIIVSGTQWSDICGSEAERAAQILELVHACDKSGILNSVTAAQMILESGYCTTALSKYNNVFGMKQNLSGNKWSGSTWDGESVVNIETPEDDGYGNIYKIRENFRVYTSLEKSIQDHAAYLLGATIDGVKKRYAGLTECKNYTEAITLIKNGGYATDSKYISKVCNIIVKYGLDKYDKGLQGLIVDWCKKLDERLLGDIQVKHHWTYAHNGYSRTIDDAVESNNRKTNCVVACNWVLKKCGLYSKGLLNHKGGDYTFSNNDVKKAILDNFVITKPNKTVSALVDEDKLNPGDICFFEGHMNIYMGPISAFDAGRSRTDTKDVGGKFLYWLGTNPYLHSKVTYLIRPKGSVPEQDTLVKTYHIQAGAYSIRANAEAMRMKISSLGIKAFIAESGGYYTVQVGDAEAYTTRSDAEKIVSKLGANNIASYIY